MDLLQLIVHGSTSKHKVELRPDGLRIIDWCPHPSRDAHRIGRGTVLEGSNPGPVTPVDKTTTGLRFSQLVDLRGSRLRFVQRAAFTPLLLARTLLRTLILCRCSALRNICT